MGLKFSFVCNALFALPKAIVNYYMIIEKINEANLIYS